MFSVIIPAYNCERTIFDVLECVLKQTRADLIDEIIIVNDGSVDNTDLIVRGYIKEHKNNGKIAYRYIVQENRGVSHTRNRAISMASSEWIALLDSDDIWYPDKLKRQYECIEENPDMCFLGTVFPMKILIRKLYGGLHKLKASQLCIRNMPSTPSVVFKREVGIELGLFNETMYYGEDINFFQKFLLKDSYYILAEDLIEISIGKKYFAESGLSSNLKKMNEGRNQNTVELYKLGLINRPFLILMLALNHIKYLRRTMQKALSGIKYKETLRGKNMFSVIIPAYNCEKTIERAMDSVLSQTRIELVEELIIVNDGSVDRTEEVVLSYKKRHEDVIRLEYIKQENHGVSHARNTGIKRAAGKWIALLDADDIWMENKLERQAEILFGGVKTK